MKTLNHFVFLFLVLTTFTSGCNSSSSPKLPTYSVANFDLLGKVRNTQGIGVSNQIGEICAAFRVMECGGYINRIACYPISTNQNGEFVSTFSLRAGQLGCKERTKFDSIDFYVEIPANGSRFDSLAHLGNYCYNDYYYHTKICNYESAMIFDQSTSVNSNGAKILGYSPQIIPGIPGVIAPNFRVLPIFSSTGDSQPSEIASIHRFTHKHIIREKDLTIEIPKFLADQRTMWSSVLESPQNADATMESISKNIQWTPDVLPSKRASWIKSVLEELKETFPYGVPAGLRAQILDQLSDPKNVRLASDQVHAVLELNFGEENQKIQIHLSKTEDGKSWMVDLNL